MTNEIFSNVIAFIFVYIVIAIDNFNKNIYTILIII